MPVPVTAAVAAAASYPAIESCSPSAVRNNAPSVVLLPVVVRRRPVAELLSVNVLTGAPPALVNSNSDTGAAAADKVAAPSPTRTTTALLAPYCALPTSGSSSSNVSSRTQRNDCPFV